MTEPGRPEPQRLAKRLAAQLPCSRADAERYLQMHRERLAGWGIVDLAVTIRGVNAALSGLSGAADATALGARAALEA